MVTAAAAAAVAVAVAVAVAGQLASKKEPQTKSGVAHGQSQILLALLLLL